MHNLFTGLKGSSVNKNHQNKGGPSKDPWKEQVNISIQAAFIYSFDVSLD